MSPLAKTLLILVLIYYLFKGIVYLIMWQATVKMAENVQEQRRQHREKRYQDREIRRAQRRDELEKRQSKEAITNIGLSRNINPENDMYGDEDKEE
ncbi:MAG: hypothetical protein GXY16_10320 [Syntrophomonadaceae bacterium]|nr:hypothetical protein [Syntrophomonadaceae bacterium]